MNVKSETGNGKREPSEPKGLLRNPWFLSGLLGIIAITIITPFVRHIPEPPPVIGQLPAFELLDQDGQPFGSEQLSGNIYIAHTFFTTCQTVCPPLMRAMAGLQGRYDREERARRAELPIRLVSITVDPFNDTPERLRETAAEYDVDFDRWTLLTGDEEAIRQLVVDGFMTDIGEAEEDPEDVNLISISHSSRLILVDASGGIRGYFDTDELGLDEIFHRSLHLWREMYDRGSD